uniref:Uncharacterized protein n=1 Tax=Plectus sambesii TaxID=2011161 RepID=A0A914XM28_9BILA
MGTSINKPAHSSDLGYSNTRIIEQKPSNVSASNQPGAQLGFYAEKAKNENSQTSAIDQETDSEKLKKQWPEENTSIANDPPPSYAESESDAQRARGASLPSSTLREPEVGATKLLYPEPIGKTRALSNISERDTDVSASGSFSKSGSGSATSNESE